MQVTRYLGWGIFSPYFLPGPIYPILSHAKPLVASQKLSMHKVPRGGVGQGAGNAAPEPTSSSVLHLVLQPQGSGAPALHGLRAPTKTRSSHPTGRILLGHFSTKTQLQPQKSALVWK